MRVEATLGDGGYDTRTCFESIAGKGAVPGIKMRKKNAQTESKGSPDRMKALLEQKKNHEE